MTPVTGSEASFWKLRTASRVCGPGEPIERARIIAALGQKPLYVENQFRRNRGLVCLHFRRGELEVIEQLLAGASGHRQFGIVLIPADGGAGARSMAPSTAPG